MSFVSLTSPLVLPSLLSSSTGYNGGASGLSTGAIVGILIVVFFVLLVGVDVTCYFLNKCGLLMCLAVNMCGKRGPGAKAKDAEEGKAAFTKDESKEPIVEVRTEEETAPNQEGGGATEPNETTPLTEPEPATRTFTTPAVILLPSTTTNSESYSTAQSSPVSECTTLAASPTKANPAPSNCPASSPQPEVGALVDLSEGQSLPDSTPEPASSPPLAPPVASPTVDATEEPTPQSSTGQTEYEHKSFSTCASIPTSCHEPE
uniref:Neural cell adhesion molecule 1 n=1 Tax=Knipowitschia caucasica TaxID=637954 RepID=A0AAV2J8B9_KNICA